MITSTEVQHLREEKIVQKALSALAASGNTLAEARHQSGFEEAGNGSYDSDDEFTRYEQIGDVIGEYPVRM